MEPATGAIQTKDDTAAYENICGICFTELHPIDNPRGRLNSCDHLFCSYCIKEWAKNTNVCPSCKARFTRIFTLRPHAASASLATPAAATEEVTKVRKRNYIAWESTYYDDEEEDEEAEEGGESRSRGSLSDLSSSMNVACDVCRQSHNAARMIFCDRRQCSFVAHLDCLSLSERPVTFLCPNCSKERQEEAEEMTLLLDLPSATTPVPTVTPPSTAPRTTHPPRQTPLPPAAAHVAKHATPPPAPATPIPASTSGNAPTSTPTTPAVPPQRRQPRNAVRPAVAAPVDFSKPNFHLLLPTRHHSQSIKEQNQQRQGGQVEEQQQRNQRSSSARNASLDQDADLYFLAPSPHSTAATVELRCFQDARSLEAENRRQTAAIKTRRLEAMGVPVLRPGQRGVGIRASSRVTDDATLLEAEQALRDPLQRQATEMQLTRRWAATIVPVLRRNRYIEGLETSSATAEAEIWATATAQARRMVQERLQLRDEALRRQREEMVAVQSRREAAALAKLARIIALHRQRESTATPPGKRVGSGHLAPREQRGRL